MELVDILKNCPKNTELYSIAHGKVYLQRVYDSGSEYPILCSCRPNGKGGGLAFTRDGYLSSLGECVLFPSKENRDWSKFKRPAFQNGDHVIWKNSDGETLFGAFLKYSGDYCYVNLFLYKDATEEVCLFEKDLTKVEKFDPKWLKPGDTILIRDNDDEIWCYTLFSHIIYEEEEQYFVASCISWTKCIPYNKETKHLVGKTAECPEFYKTW